MTASSKIISFPQAEADRVIESYVKEALGKHDSSTVEVYQRILRHFSTWAADLPGQEKRFVPAHLTKTTIEVYLSTLRDQGYSVSHRSRVKSVLSGFCQWLLEEKEVIKRNPVRGIKISAEQTLAPRVLEPNQRFVLRTLVDQDEDLRGKAIFALGYFAGCRVSDVAHLLMEHTHVGPKVGWLYVGHKGEKFREIDLLNEVRKPLHDYLTHGGRDRESPYVFTSQRSPQLTEAGIHHWFRALKRNATKEQWALIADVTFHDLRHDFAHRAREAGWSLEELAYYLGHVTLKGMPAIQTTIRYTQVSRAHVKEKLKLLKG